MILRMTFCSAQAALIFCLRLGPIPSTVSKSAERKSVLTRRRFGNLRYDFVNRRGSPRQGRTGAAAKIGFGKTLKIG